MIKIACNHCEKVVNRENGYIRFEIQVKIIDDESYRPSEYFEVCNFECAHNLLREIEAKQKIMEKKNDSQRTNQPAE